MGVYCKLKSSHSIEAHHHERYLIQLELKNPNEESEKIDWKVTFPAEVEIVQPHHPLAGSNLLIPGTQEIVSSWRVDISRMPDAMRAATLARIVVRADITIMPLGAQDFCETKISK